MRLGGIATGLDTDTMVKQMMMPYQMRADKIKQEKVLLEYKQSMYREISNDMKNIYTKYFDIGSSANKGTNLILSGNYDTVKFSSSDESVVTARGVAGAKTGNYEVTVEQKASASSITIDGERISGDTLSIKIGDAKELEVSLKDKDGKSIIGNNKEIVNNINKAIEENNKTEGNEKIDVKVTSSELGGNIRIESTKTGAENDVKMSASCMGKSNISKFEGASDAIVNIKDAYGNNEKKTFSSNKFTIDSVEYTINGVSGKDADGNIKSTKLTGTADSSKIIENVKSFVNDYNKLIDKMNGFIGEKRDKSFTPLTDEQKKEMSETEIKLWEEKTKRGLLRNDDILSSAVNELLGHVSTGFGTGLNLKDIGITTNPDYRTQKGKIILDEEKLSAAFENNGDETRNILTKTFDKMKDTFNEVAISSTSKLAKRAGSSEGVTAFNNELSKKMNEQQRQYEKMMRSLSKKESSYYAEFARLEVAMNKANAQMGQFMSMGSM